MCDLFVELTALKIHVLVIRVVQLYKKPTVKRDQRLLPEVPPTIRATQFLYKRKLELHK